MQAVTAGGGAAKFVFVRQLFVSCVRQGHTDMHRCPHVGTYMY